MFKTELIAECEICSKMDVVGHSEMVTEYKYISSSSCFRNFCISCFENNTYVNKYGFTFLWFKNKLFCYKPPQYLDFGFREVVNEDDIERAFNPDRYRFNEWLSEVNYGGKYDF